MGPRGVHEKPRPAADHGHVPQDHGRQLCLREFGNTHTEDSPKNPANSTFAVWQEFSVWKDREYSGDEPPHVSPGMKVVEDFEQRERDWSFELWSYLIPTTGEVRFEGRLAANLRKLGTDLNERLREEQSARAGFVQMDRAIKNLRKAISECCPSSSRVLAEKGKATIHSCRDTYATGLLNKGMRLEKVSHLLGHASVTQTQKYA